MSTIMHLYWIHEAMETHQDQAVFHTITKYDSVYSKAMADLNLMFTMYPFPHFTEVRFKLFISS